MKTFQKTLFFAALFSLILTSCSQTQTPGPQADNRQAPAQNTAASPQTVNKKLLCDLLTKEQISTVTGITFTKTESKFATNSNPYITDCIYTNDDANSVAIIANYDTPTSTAKDEYQSVVSYQEGMEKQSPETAGKTQKISGVGTEAFIVEPGILTQLNALDGNVWITLSIFTGGGEKQKDLSIAIAKKAFEVL